MLKALGRPRAPRTLRGALALSVCSAIWLAYPTRVDEAALTANAVSHIAPATSPAATRAAAQRSVPVAPDLRELLARVQYQHTRAAERVETTQLRIERAQQVLHSDLSLHGRGAQLYTAWDAPMTLKAMNWYGFEYAPFVPDGLDSVTLDTILGSLRSLGFNALRITFANQTVEQNPVVTSGVAANPGFRGRHSLDIMQRILARAHHFGVRVILCNTRSEAGRGPELRSGLWYTNRYPENQWAADWATLVQRFKRYTSLVGVDLRNEPHIVGTTFDQSSVLNNGPLWGAFQGTYYRPRDWRYAAQTVGNQLLSIDPQVLIIIEGVQMYLDPDKHIMTGGLWGSNLIGVQYDPVVLSRPSQLVYSVHEYGPQMWQGDWFTPKTTYRSLKARWNKLWGYLLTARTLLRAPIFVGEFGTCHEYYACVASSQGWKQGFWFQSFVRYMSSHPQVGWAYWALNPLGPFRPTDDDFYSLVTRDWHHYYPMLTFGLAPLLREPNGLWPALIPLSANGATRLLPQPGCLPGKSCIPSTLAALALTPTSKQTAGDTVPIAPPLNTQFSVQVQSNISYVQPSDGVRLGDLYRPVHAPAMQRPAVIVLHGGSWADGTKGQPGTVSVARAFAQNGYIAFDINYRLAGRGGTYPGDVQDVKDAVGFLVSNHDRYGIDVKRLALVGAGAGGHLALLAGYSPRRPPLGSPHYSQVDARIGVVADFFGATDLAKLEQRSPDPNESAALAQYLGAPYASTVKVYVQASPITYLSSSVSTIIFHGLADPSVPMWQPFDLYRALRQHKAPSKLVDLPGAPHGFADLSPQQLRIAIAQTIAFIDGVLYKPPPAE